MRRFLAMVFVALILMLTTLAMPAGEDMTLSVDVLVVQTAPLDNIMSYELMPIIQATQNEWNSEFTEGTNAEHEALSVTDPGVRIITRGFNILKMPTSRGA